MKHKHIAVFPGVGNGHVYPVLGLCSELVKRGYRITCFTNNYYADHMKAIGAEPVTPLHFHPRHNRSEQPSGPQPPEKRPWLAETFGGLHPQDKKRWLVAAFFAYPSMLAFAAQMLPELESFYKKAPPDLILYDRIAFVGRLIAKRLDCPAVQMYPHFAFHNNMLHRENGICWNPEPMIEFSKMFDFFMSTYGIDKGYALWHTEELNIYFLPKEFQHHGDSFDERHCFAGACLNRPFRPSWASNHGLEGPLVLVSDSSIGTDVNYFHQLIEAVSKLECNVVLSVGKHVSERDFGTLPDNVEINQHASHLEILPHAAVSVCAAGMGSVLEALYHGVPLIVSPITQWHEEVAYRVVELGLGIHLPRQNVTSDLICETMTKALSDSSLRDRVCRTQEVFKRSIGEITAAESIGRFLGVGREL